MKRLAIVASLALAPAGLACGSASSEAGLASDYGNGSSSAGGAYTASMSGGAASGGGLGGSEPRAFGYAELCGAGCVPGTGVATPCELPPDEQGGGGQGGGGSGGAEPGSGGGISVGAGGAGGSMQPASGDCRLSADDDGVVGGECRVVGDSAAGQPCLGAADCAAGLGCTADGACRPYCCGDVELCPEASYCVPRPMHPGDVPMAAAAPDIPVCAPVEPCTLLDDKSCMVQGQSCTIVRKDGTTSCALPGEGRAGDVCSAVSGVGACAAGHVCSLSLGKCLRICRADKPECPANHACQGGTQGVPAGFGVCVPLS